MRYVLGLDAGGTKTVAFVAGEDGAPAGEARGGGANLHTHGELDVEKVLHDVMKRAAAGREIAALCLRVVNYAVIALVAGAPERQGVVVLAGTGSIGYGADAQGGTTRVCGLGWILADEGSAQWRGREALRAAVRAADGRGPQTALYALALEALKAEGLSDLVARVYERDARPSDLGRLACTVEAAGQGDPVASAILDHGATELALAARAVHDRLVFDAGPVPVVLAGGAFRACPSPSGEWTRASASPARRVGFSRPSPPRAP